MAIKIITGDQPLQRISDDIDVHGHFFSKFCKVEHVEMLNKYPRSFNVFDL